MTKAMDVANILIDTLKSSEDPLTNARLNKLLYFAQGHCLERLGEPLFDDDIEAWEFGPVVPEIYHSFKSQGKYAQLSNLGPADRSVLSPEKLELLLDVILAYEGRSTKWMINESHRSGSPWDLVYDSTKKNVPISKESIRAYFSKEPLPSMLNELLSNVKTIGHIDSKGHFVLPEDWDD